MYKKKQNFDQYKLSISSIYIILEFRLSILVHKNTVKICLYRVNEPIIEALSKMRLL